ncbi:2-succinyl-5-enolpyruvyl-6-hydroxy-3-cyclohexene-1-carboxylic-acid synthase [Actinomycetospora sp. TBRC 11914]|uniref:2-succinyl-5-enolpyruvyl-6-hydroxy-3- cyclohexene-1-carboxylic-acid synthase n=1 Tax=Actinomycetospora sp. TBRC 11914 TaxID=2729387 RepID=UPI00145EB12F|nr:2-succinyl-5-enolpyruvyl-6-hydroxy-3-cyclohexene-1-carboxylic-acid synthase [Actinomycetospora sp. TBRC 11914]NMO91875.1 2-succinyl-5-enolpyruvyl-6-hydroxy-3-cyclohexene-1-carboxylic-acid synthase [Actinomycetospora sp. TBRC 11914]
MNPSTVQARVVVDEWVRGGVRDVVACPGSRNAPLLLAAHAADAAGRLRLHMRIDERSAGFLAVGLAAASGRPVPVVVTSGTAVAELHPAVLEASHAGVPLVVASADRPLELLGTGANQTVDQAGLFGGAVRASVVLPLAEDRPRAAAGWRAAVCRVLDRAAGTGTADPGPVQLDLPLREPLVPGEPDPDDDADLPGWAAGRPDGGPWTRVASRAPRVGALDLSSPVPTVVVAGHGAAAPDGLPDGVPVVAEPTSPLWGRGLRAGTRLLDAALGGSAPGLLPARVVVLGRPTLHRPVSRLLADPRVEVVVVPAAAAGAPARPGWTDVAGTAAQVGALPPPPAWGVDEDYGARVAAADARVADALGDAVEEGTGPALAAAVVAALPAGALLVVGSSSPVRDVSLAARPREDVTVVSARGVSGIDGAVSFATGAALAQDSPAYALLGDLTFLHDSGGLLVGAHEPRPELVVVVANDDGGSVFATLEQGAAEYAGAFERVFAVPHGTDLAALCRAHHVEHTAPSGPAELTAALAPTGRRGVRVVEVVVDRADRRGLADRQRQIALDALRRYQIGCEAAVPDKPDGTTPIGSIVNDGA